jgi:hypothetical protein
MLVLLLLMVMMMVQQLCSCTLAATRKMCNKLSRLCTSLFGALAEWAAGSMVLCA